MLRIGGQVAQDKAGTNARDDVGFDPRCLPPVARRRVKVKDVATAVLHVAVLCTRPQRVMEAVWFSDQTAAWSRSGMSV